MTENSPWKRTTQSGAMPLAPVTRRVALATIEPESHLTLPPTWRASYREVKTVASMLFIVWGLWWLGWTQEHKNHVEKTQWFILVRANSVPTSNG